MPLKIGAKRMMSISIRASRFLILKLAYERMRGFKFLQQSVYITTLYSIRKLLRAYDAFGWLCHEYDARYLHMH